MNATSEMEMTARKYDKLADDLAAVESQLATIEHRAKEDGTYSPILRMVREMIAGAQKDARYFAGWR